MYIAPEGFVVLSIKYPKVFVTDMLKTAMVDSKKPGSFLFKRIMQSLLSKKKIWHDRVMLDVLRDYPGEVGAAFGKLSIIITILHK